MWLFCLLDPFIPTQIKFLATPLLERSSLSKVGFLSRGDTTDTLRVGWKLPELRERLMILAIVIELTEVQSNAAVLTSYLVKLLSFVAHI